MTKASALSLLFITSLLVPTFARSEAACSSWPLWQQFKTLYVSNDGRVIDAGTDARITTSEGQAYAMMFALAANDRAAFNTLLNWTENNLAQGHLDRNLPAWQWGHATDGQWRVLDNNAASDADVWLTFALSEAGRLWREPRYTQLGSTLSEHILREEAMWAPKLGLTLLPAPRGFVEDSTWRFNASYLPLQVLRYLGATHDKLWNDIADSSLRIIQASTPRGFTSDWIEYRSDLGFITDRTTQGVGSYDAIRVYLWAGMLQPRDPVFTTLKQLLTPALEQFAAQTRAAEHVDTHTLALRGTGPWGFTAAFLPLLSQSKPAQFIATMRDDILQHALKNNQAYFSDVLTLFGIGANDGWLRFDRRGQLIPKWRASCAAP